MHIKDGPHLRQVVTDLVTDPAFAQFMTGALYLVALFAAIWLPIYLMPRVAYYVARRARIKFERRADELELGQLREGVTK